MKKQTISAMGKEKAFVYQPRLGRALGSLQAGVMLSYITAHANGNSSIEISPEEVMRDTALSLKRQVSGLNRCSKKGVLDIEPRQTPEESWKIKLHKDKMAELMQKE